MRGESPPARTDAPQRPRRVSNRSVSFRLGRRVVTQIGGQRASWREGYHYVLSLNWLSFLGLVALLFFTINALFGAAFWLVPGSLANARPGSFADAFFFSVETLATVGYGDMFPATFYAHVVASFETFVGLIGVAMTTGIAFVRFSRPRARIMFANHPVVASFNGVPTLMLRAANERHNLLLEASARVTLNRREVTMEGGNIRRLIDLDLARNQNPTFALTWTIMHTIDSRSPLYGRSAEQLRESDEVLIVSITGIDETLNDTIHARHEYPLSMIRLDHRYADVVMFDGDRLTVDLTQFHEVVPVPPSAETPVADH
jgi:inward rectifier potassium channel